MTAAQAGSAAIAASAVTSAKGSEALLAPCLGRAGVSGSETRVERDRDDVSRSAALPRALLQPLASRPAGEVQGLGPRNRVDAREPARPARDLPARVLAALEGDRRRPSGALPALRARRVDLLLDLDPRRVPQHARQRKPDPEDPLS